MRAVRVARSLGRDSRLMKRPVFFPAPYLRSSTPAVRGKKSAPGRASCAPTAVTRTMVSPERTTTAPFACLASLPVSNSIGTAPTSTVTFSTAISHPLSAPPFLGWAPRVPSPPGAGPLSRPSSCSSAAAAPPRQAELPRELGVGVQVLALQVVQQPPPAPDHLQQPSPRVMVLRVRLQVLGEPVDPLGEDRDLYLRRSRVRVVLAVGTDDLRLRVLGQHSMSSLSRGAA